MPPTVQVAFQMNHTLCCHWRYFHEELWCGWTFSLSQSLKAIQSDIAVTVVHGGSSVGLLLKMKWISQWLRDLRAELRSSLSHSACACCHYGWRTACRNALFIFWRNHLKMGGNWLWMTWHLLIPRLDETIFLFIVIFVFFFCFFFQRSTR